MSVAQQLDPIQILSVASGGRHYLAVDGLPVQPRPSDDTPLTAALRLVARMIHQELGDEGEAIAVLTEGQSQTHYLVRGNGEYEELADPTPEQGSQEEPEPAASSVSEPEASEQTTGWTPQDAPRARSGRQARARSERPRRGAHSSTQRTSRKPALIVGAAAVVTLVALGVAYTQLKDQPSADPGAGQAAQKAPSSQPVQGAPLGYRATPSWTSGALSQDVPPVITLEGEAVTVEEGNELVGRTVQGDQRWSMQLPAAARQLAVRTVEGVRSAVVVTDTHLLSYNMDTGDPVLNIALPEGTRVNLLSPAPLVALAGNTDAIAVVKDGQLALVRVPKGMTPIGGGTDGVVLMGSGNGWVRVTPGTPAGKVQPWTPPTSKTVRGSRPQIAAVTSTGKILTVWPIEGGGEPQVAVYADSPRGVRLAFRTPLLSARAGQKLQWTRSGDGTWGVIGQQMIDLDSGRVEPLGPATDLSLGVGRGCATIGQQRAVFGPKVPLGVLEPNEKCPAAVLDQTALVVDGPYLKALPAKDAQ